MNKDRLRFHLTSDQLELLLAFEEKNSLSSLAESMAKDQSVVSRNLQRLAEDLPVLKKAQGRWHITPLGIEVNKVTRSFLVEFGKIVPKKDSITGTVTEACFSSRATLLVINAQAALLDPSLGHRSNTDAEKNIQELLSLWRRFKMPIIHVKHISENLESAFYRKAKGAEFMPMLSPAKGELVIEKLKASAFSGTELSNHLQEQEIDTLILTGFTANECIDATARQASDLGFTCYVVGDATAMFDFSGPDGKLMKADRIHRLTLANLNALFAKVVDTEFLIKGLANKT